MTNKDVKLMLEENSEEYLFVGDLGETMDVVASATHENLLQFFVALSENEKMWNYMFSACMLRLFSDEKAMDGLINVASSIYGIDFTKDSIFNICNQ